MLTWKFEIMSGLYCGLRKWLCLAIYNLAMCSDWLLTYSLTPLGNHVSVKIRLLFCMEHSASNFSATNLAIKPHPSITCILIAIYKKYHEKLRRSRCTFQQWKHWNAWIRPFSVALGYWKSLFFALHFKSLPLRKIFTATMVNKHK